MNKLLISQGIKPRTGKALKCKTCEKEFYTKPSQSIKAKYCSYLCKYKSSERKERRICAICNKLVERPASAFKWGIKRGGSKFYCSVECTAKGTSKRLKGTVSSKLWSMRRADRMFSDYIRNRDGWICRYCGKDFREKSGQLHNSHYWSRKRKSTRFDENNCIALCYSCHLFKFEKEKQGEYKDLMIEWLGQEKYNLLKEKAEIEMSNHDAIKEFMAWITPKLKDQPTVKKRKAMIVNEFGQSYLD